MKIALIGHGKMGKETERVARGEGETVCAVYDSEHLFDAAAAAGVDVCIDFSTAEATLGHMKSAAGAGIDIVVGTTGWYSQLDEVRELFTQSALLYANNFSIGMNVFYRIVREAAALIEPLSDYDPYVLEHHNRDKEDRPSGTALKLGEILLDGIGRKQRIEVGVPMEGVSEDALQIVSVRAGSVPGSHTIGFESEADTIELHHASKNRTGFAMGALVASRWVRGRQGVYTMDDVDR